MEPLEDALIGLPMGVIGRLESGVVDVEGIGVLHDELAHSQDAGPGPRLVPVLDLDLVQHQGKILIGAVLPLYGQREHFFVGRGQQVIVAAAVLQPKNAVAVFGPPVGRLVRCPRQQGREQDLLAADHVHLLAHDPFDVPQHAQTEGQPAVEPRRDRPHVAGTDQQLVARYFGIGGGVAQCAQEQLGHPGDHSAQA